MLVLGFDSLDGGMGGGADRGPGASKGRWMTQVLGLAAGFPAHPCVLGGTSELSADRRAAKQLEKHITE